MNKKFKILLVSIALCLGFQANVSAEEYSETFQKLTTDGTIQVNAIENPIVVGNTEWETEPVNIILQNILGGINLGENQYFGWDCSSSTECKIFIHENKIVDGNYTSKIIETHDVKIKYMAKKDDSIATSVEKVINQIKTMSFSDREENYMIEDLNLINYYLTKKQGSSVSNAMNFVPDIISLTQNQPITISLVSGMGSSGADDIKDITISNPEAGEATVYYNGIAYGYIGFTGTELHNIIYIPEETENTKEAYVEAIKARLNNSNIEVTCAGAIPEESEKVIVSTDGIDLSLTDGNYYNLKINGHTYQFVVMKKEELNVPKYQQTEQTTGIQITTTDLSVPYDTVVTVEEVEENTEEYNKIKEVLKLDTFKAFDISLYSETLGTHITKLENGKFQVMIPIGKEYIGKTLVAYYIHEDNTIEEHDIVMDEEGNAIFETDHFSTYIIAEKIIQSTVTEVVPDTYDGINNYIVLGVVSMLVLGGVIYSNKKQIN